MSINKILIAMAAAIAFSIPAASAQDDERNLSMISLFDVDPSKEAQFDKAWATIRDIAMESGYEYTDYVGGWRNQRWIVTPLKNYADVDALMAARDAVGEAGGKKFEKALASFSGAMTNSHTFFSRDDNELSYWPNGAPTASYMEIDTYHYRYGEQDELRGLLAEYKALMEEKESPYGYQISWDGIGSEGNSFTVISYAADAVAMAEANAAVGAMLDGDKKADSIFERFQKISTGSQTTHGTFNPEASINLPGN